jgi:hypothetical protein
MKKDLKNFPSFFAFVIYFLSTLCYRIDIEGKQYFSSSFTSFFHPTAWFHGCYCRLCNATAVEDEIKIIFSSASSSHHQHHIQDTKKGVSWCALMNSVYAHPDRYCCFIKRNFLLEFIDLRWGF